MLQLATPADWEAVKRLSVQIHDLHVQWRPDVYYHCDEPLTHDLFLELIRERMIYVAKVSDTVAGYMT